MRCLFIAAVGFAGISVSATAEEWVDCAGEKQFCYFSGEKTVRYGASDTFAEGTFTDQVYCANSVFGDPISGVAKRCSYLLLAEAPSFLALEDLYGEVGQSVDINLQVEAASDAVLSFSASGLPSGVTINPATGALSGSLTERGYWLVDVTVSDEEGNTDDASFQWQVDPTGSWSDCAAEKAFCDFDGLAEVRYGAGVDYAVQQHSDGVSCTNAVFGDPAPGQVKRCSFRTVVASIQLSDLPDREDYAGKTVSFEIDAESEDNELTYSATGLPSGLALNTQSGVISGQFAAVGNYSVQVTVTNSSGGTASDSFNWTILEPLGMAGALNSSSLFYDSETGASDRLWIANPDNDTVSVFNTQNNQKLAEISVGGAPQNLVGVDSEIWVVNRDSASISIINASTLAEVEEMALPQGSAPYGIVVDASTNQVYVSLSATGQVVKINSGARAIVQTLEVGIDIRALAISQGAETLYVSRFISPLIPGESGSAPQTEMGSVSFGGEVYAVDLAVFSIQSKIVLAHSYAMDTRLTGRGIPNYVGAMAISPAGDFAWVPSKQDNIKRGSARDGQNLNHENTVRAIASRIDLNSNQEILADRLDLDDASMATAAIVDPSGKFLFVALETSRSLAIINLDTGALLPRAAVGLAPRSLAFSDDGQTLYAHNFMSRSVTKLDISDLLDGISNTVSALATYNLVANEKLAANVLLGKQLFYDAADPRLALEGYLSCASCHNDGGHDGRVWDFTGLGEGLRNTIDLNGRGGDAHGALHWSANFDEVQDFEGQIRSLSLGTGLLSNSHFLEGDRQEPLGLAKAGLSADLDALAAYVESLTDFPANPFKGQSFSSAAERGRTYFADKGCSGCHSGTAFTDSQTLARHDIGTLSPLSGSRLGQTLDGLDTPTLRGLWATGPYLHDGSAGTIKEAITSHSNVFLTDSESSDIEAYLLELDSSEASAPLASEWILCATEGTQCQFSGVKEVRFGANGTYAYQIHEGGVLCSNSVFGDPLPEVAKACHTRTASNLPPTINSIPSQINDLNDSVTLLVSAVDPEGAGVTYSASGLPESLVLDSLTGEISGTLTIVGTYSVTIVATDADTNQSSITFNWVVVDPEEPDSGWVHCADEGQTCQFSGQKEVRFGADGTFNTGVYTDSVSCRWKVFGDPLPGVVKYCEYKVSGNSLPAITPIEDLEDAPGNSIEFAVIATDQDGDTLSYAASGLPEGLAIDETTGLISGVISMEGTFTVTVSVDDGSGTLVSESFTWLVEEGLGSSGSWVFCANEKQVCSFDGVREVRFGAQGVYAVEVHDSQVTCSTKVFGDPLPEVAKKCYFNDDGNSSPTILPISDQTSVVGDAVTLAVVADDADDDQILYSAAGLPTGLSIDEDVGLITGSLNVDGDFYVTVSVVDSLGAQAQLSFVWTVTTAENSVDWEFCANENQTCSFTGIREVRFGAQGQYNKDVFEGSVLCSKNIFGDPVEGVAKTCSYRISGNNPPVIPTINDQYSALGAAVSLFVEASDLEGDILTYSVTNLPTGLQFDFATGEIWGTTSEEGTFEVMVVVTDDSGASNSQSFYWIVASGNEGDENWVPCASEGQLCSFQGQQLKVRFGANGAFNVAYFNNAVYCSASAFGDPLPGVEKSCSISVYQTPEGWTQCAEQGEICNISGTKLVRYGAYGEYSYRVAMNSIPCGGDSFKDPIGGVFKYCEYQSLPAANPTYPVDKASDENWVFCSPNGLTCHFPGTKQVRYKLGDKYAEVTATNSIQCTESSFGADPIPLGNMKEHCEVLLKRSEVGEWSYVQDWPLVGVHATLMPDGRILAHNATNDDLYSGYSEATLWDPVSHTFKMIDANETTFAEQASEMFCAGFDLLPDGSLLTSGSEPNVNQDNDRNANRFDFQSERFSRVADNKVFRYYPSVAVTENGEMVSFAGSTSFAPLEVYKFDGSWDVLGNTSDTFLNSKTYYAWGQTAPNGQLFYPGPTPVMRYFDLRGEGAETQVGSRDSLDRDYGSYALYDIGKMFITGGAKPATNSTVLIDINGPSPIVTPGPNMGMARRHGNLTILADGSLLKTGGHTGDTHQDFQPDKAVFSAELWSPETGQWATMSSMRINRLYHSTAVLLPDGRIMSAGTGYPYYLKHNESNNEIFSPPYLFNEDGSLADRPVISGAPNSIGYDHNFTIDVNSSLPINKVHLVKLGSVTHHQNFGQRLVPLEFNQSGGSVSLTGPEGGNIAPPGYYMLFVVDSNGVPSVAKFVKVLQHPTVSLISAANNFSLDIAGNVVASGAQASVKAQNNQLSQLWSVIPVDSGFFKLVSRASGYVLTNGSTGVLTLTSDSGNQNQHWEFAGAEDGYHYIESRYDGTRLSVTSQGALDLGSGSSENHFWQILPYGDINLVVEENGDSLRANGANNVATTGQAGQIEDAWYFKPAADGYATIVSRGGKRALAATGSGAIQQAAENGSNSQQWRLVVNDSGSFRIENRAVQEPLKLSGNSSVVAQSGSVQGDANESWRLVPAVSGQPNNNSIGGGQILYRALVDGSGWIPWVTNGLPAGNSNLSGKIKSLEVRTNGVREGLGVSYEVYDAVSQWAGGSNGATAGSKQQNIHGVRMNLTGDSQGCDLSYRVHLEGSGWQALAAAGEIAGSTGSLPAITGVDLRLSCTSASSNAGKAGALLNVMEKSTDIDNSAFHSGAYKLRNTSSGGQKITKVEIDLSTAILPDLLWDPIGGAGDADPACFESLTGQQETGVLPIDPCATPFSVFRDGGFEIMTIEFDDFDPGETLLFGADVDPTTIKNASYVGKSGSVSGLELSGSTVGITFSDGTVITRRLFSDGSVGGSQSCFNSTALAAPTLTVDGISSFPASVSAASQTINVFSQPNSTVLVNIVEAALHGDGVYDLDPYEANSAIKVSNYSVVTDAQGVAQLDIDLTHNSVISDPGYNYIQAAVKDGPNCTGNMANLGVIYLD